MVGSRDRLAFLSDLASRAALFSLLSNADLMVLKLVVAVMSGSVAVLSDGIDSAEDVMASAFVLWSVRLSARPADEEHPYGHGGAESIAASAQAVLITGGAAFIGYQAIQRLIVGEVEIGIGLGLAAMLVTGAVNLGVVFYVSRAARRTGSLALRSDTRHLVTNIAQALAVVLALVLVGLTGRHEFDAAVALLLAGYLLWTAWRIFAGASRQIMDVRLPEEEERVVQETLARHPGQVFGYHKLRSRRLGRHRYVELHVVVDPKRTLEEVHALLDSIEGEIKSALADAEVTIHAEPDDGRPRHPRSAGR